MLITIAETPSFQRAVRSLLSEQEREHLLIQLACHPEIGVAIPETGGIRKLRWGRAGRGKSSGVRVIYFFHNHTMPLYLLDVFGKNESALVIYWRSRNGQSIH